MRQQLRIELLIEKRKHIYFANRTQDSIATLCRAGGVTPHRQYSYRRQQSRSLALDPAASSPGR